MLINDYLQRRFTDEEKPKKLKLIVADGSAVDPESQLQVFIMLLIMLDN